MSNLFVKFVIHPFNSPFTDLPSQNRHMIKFRSLLITSLVPSSAYALFKKHVLSALLCLGLLVMPLTKMEAQGDWWTKVDSSLLAQLTQDGHAEFMIVLTQQADLRLAKQFNTKKEKGKFVFETASKLASETQLPVINRLSQHGAPFRSFWIVNAIWSAGDLALVEEVASLSMVARIDPNPVVPLHTVPPDSITSDLPSDRDFTTGNWGLTKINADDVWAMGHTGSGVVVGGQDTGYEWAHPAIKDQYRGWNNNTANHNYNWHDAIHDTIHVGNNSCGLNKLAPCDDNNHGTHTMGTMVGAIGDNAIGVAPDAKWIGCRNMEEGDGTPTTYIECFEWFVAPTDLNDANPDSDEAPHVINNSWGCPVSEGCTSGNFSTMQIAVDAARNAGILVAVSAGNDGSGCATVKTPAAIYASSFSVGATNDTDGIAGFSSRGPVTVDGSNRKKPNISAPGVSIYSCVGRDNLANTYSYASYQGTSMAAPHIAGVAALLMSARPDLIGNVDELENLMENTAVPRYATSPYCGGENGSTRPNNFYGWGRVDALAAVNAALALPVELVHFEAINREKDVLIEWRTASEINCASFTIERSANGLHWHRIGALSCTGTGSGGAEYRFADLTPLEGTNYYRLYQEDVDGTGTYSPVRVIQRTGPSTVITVTPNPATGTMWIDLSKNARYDLEMFSLDGRFIRSFPLEKSGMLALPYLPAGIYFLHFRNAFGQVVDVQKMWWP
jgi:serine protease AprX